MGRLLPTATTLLDLVALAMSLGLGLYILTRSPRSLISWLAALSLGGLATFFLHNALIINQPDSALLPWLRPVILLVLALWFHLSVLLRQGQQRRRSRSNPLSTPAHQALWLPASKQSLSAAVGIVAAYAATLVLIGLSILNYDSVREPIGPTGIYQAGQRADPLYPASAALIVILGALSVHNLGQAFRSESLWVRRRQLVPLMAGTLLAILGALYLTMGIWLQVNLPAFPRDLAIAAGVVLIGFAVARYNALVEGRVIERDALYILMAVGSLTLFYVGISQVLYRGGHIFSFVTQALVIIIAISTLMLYDGLRTALDRIFYHDQFRQLRASLRSLAQEAGAGHSLPEQLRALLAALCHDMGIRRAFIALAEPEGFVVQAALGSRLEGQTLPQAHLAAQEIRHLHRQDADKALTESSFPGLEKMQLLVPLANAKSQVGALVLGRKQNGQGYLEEDLILLEDLADQLAAVIHTGRLQQESAERISLMVAEFRQRERVLQRQVQEILSQQENTPEPILQGLAGDGQWVGMVEDALRRLHDYPYLGEHPLAQLKVLSWEMDGQQDPFSTHIDRGKALSRLLVRALTKLRPEGQMPERHAVPPREWHQFIILNDSYVANELNRDIMSRLYISEGTFNRARRRAVRGIAKALEEMELEAQRQTAGE